MPIPLLVIGMTLLLTVFREDSINYSIAKGDKDMALSIIKKIYDENPVEVYEMLKNTVKMEDEGSAVTFT